MMMMMMSCRRERKSGEKGGRRLIGPKTTIFGAARRIYIFIYLYIYDLLKLLIDDENKYVGCISIYVAMLLAASC
jgi:uncharacterized membrane protein